MTPVEIDDDGDRGCRFSRRDGDNENGEEHPVEPVGPDIFIERDEIQVHTVQDQFNAHEHGDEVPPGEETEYADEEQRGADEQDMI